MKIIKIKQGYIEESSGPAPKELESVLEIASEKPTIGEVSLQKYDNLPFYQWNYRRNSAIWRAVGSVFYIKE